MNSALDPLNLLLPWINDPLPPRPPALRRTLRRFLQEFDGSEKSNFLESAYDGTADDAPLLEEASARGRASWQEAEEPTA